MAIAHVQTTGVLNGSSPGSSITLSSFAVGSGTNRSLVAVVQIWDESAGDTIVSSVVFNTSESFTYQGNRIVHQYAGTARCVVEEIWFLDNPTNTTANVVATVSGSGATRLSLSVSEYTGANNGFETTYAGAEGNTNLLSVTATTVSADNIIIAGSHSGLQTKTHSSTSATQRWEDNGAGPDNHVHWEQAATGGSDTVNMTLDTGTRSCSMMSELTAAAAAGGSATPIPDNLKRIRQRINHTLVR